MRQDRITEKTLRLISLASGIHRSLATGHGWMALKDTFSESKNLLEELENEVKGFQKRQLESEERRNTTDAL